MDLSAALDSTNHKIKLNVMENEIGATDNVKKWFDSYLTRRSMRVTTDGTLSELTEIHYHGVSQGKAYGYHQPQSTKCSWVHR